MEKKPDSLTKQFIIENAIYSLESSFHYWRAWIWQNVVLLSVLGAWPAKHYPHYFSDFWDIFCERKKSWDKVYFVVETNNMPIQSEEFGGYMQENWAHLLDREDFCLCIIEFQTMKRAIWKSIYRLINVQSKIYLFKDHTSALEWVQEDRSLYNSKAKNLKCENAMPEELNLEWVRKHAHIHLIGKDLRWSITACRNIIILKIQKHWTTRHIKEYLDHISGLTSLLLENWNRIFLIFDVILMEFTIKEAQCFLQLNRLRVLDREDMIICIVAKKELIRLLWKRLLSQIGKLNRIRVFSDCDAALTWIRLEMINHVEYPA